MVGFVLFDPQDPMSKIVQKVMIGDRPSLLQGRVGKADAGFHRRHIIAYDILAKALRKLLKGYSLGKIADWLDDDTVWLDRSNINHDRKPVDGTRKVVRTVFGVQAATAGWMKNATNYAANIFIGPKKYNLQLSGAYTSGRDTVKRVWEGKTEKLDKHHQIYCCEVSSGRLVRFESMGRFYLPPAEIINIVTTNRFQSEFFFRAEPGVRFVSIPASDKDKFDQYIEQQIQREAELQANSQGNPGLIQQLKSDKTFKTNVLIRSIASIFKQHIHNLGGGLIIRRDSGGLNWLTQVSRDYDFRSVIGGDIHSNPREAALKRAQAQFLTGSVDIRADEVKVGWNDYLSAIQKLRIVGPNGKQLFLYEVAVGDIGRDKYVSFPANVPQL
jgi:hypothetical protein